MKLRVGLWFDSNSYCVWYEHIYVTAAVSGTEYSGE